MVAALGDMASKRFEESLGVLLGERGGRSKGQSAVRFDDLEGAVRDILNRIDRGGSDVATASPSSQNQENQLPDFHATGLSEDFYRWNDEARFRPPNGLGGGAALMRRNDGAGVWVAGSAWGPGGHNEPRVFYKSTSGQVDDWGDWRESYHQANINDAVGFLDGIPSGGLFQKIEAGTGEQGVAIRLAIGIQIAFVGGLALEQSSADTLIETWTYPAPFAAAPIIIGGTPTATSGTYSNVSATDCGRVDTLPSVSSAVIALRRSYGAPGFGPTARVTGVSAVAIGLWS